MNNIIAKLLARENIQIVEGKFKTASFDVKNRILRVPSWSFNSKNLYDLFIGHEVGHALYTTVDGIHEAKEIIPGVPFSYINVVEDCRIEKLIRRDFPGLVLPFKNAYAELLDLDFFGKNIQDRVDGMALIDRINVKSKLGHLINVQFNDEEFELFKLCMQTETWDDVINAIHAIMEYEKKKHEENESPSKDDTQNESVDNDDNEYDEDQTPSDEGDQEEDQDAKSSDNSNGSDTDEDKDDIDSDNFEDSVEETEIPESETDNEYRKNEAEMIEKSMTNGIDHVQVTQKNIDMAITDFAKLTELRKEVSPIPQHIIDEYKDFIKNNKKSIAPAVSQFNMCKSAYEYSRSKESKSGSISTQKLWSYKTNDDIFNRVTELATAKNHGLFILLDNSASMSSMISEIHLKLIQLLTFAKTVNIPFEVYSFTNRRDYQYSENLQVGDIYDTVALNQLSSSTLNKSQFEESLLRLYAKAHAYANKGFNGGLFDFIPPVERMDGTPMITSIVLLRQELKKFASKVEKPIFISMIDGDTSNLDYYRVHDGHYNVPKKLRIKVLNETIEMPIDTSWHSSKRNRRTAVNTFIKSLNYKTITILIRNGSQSPLQRNFIDECYSELNSSKKDLKMYIQKMIKKNGVAIFENTFGYDLVYMLQVEGAADEVEVEGQTRQELLKSFKGSFSNKKKSKVMMSHFGKFIA